MESLVNKYWKLLTPNMLHMLGDEHSLKISAPQLLQFGIVSVLNILKERITY